ncbi:uncharacterized protein [Gossypium hirsutum]|uniref:Integrase n=1 Tax=Gossypium hirsutum TaxID=3635 RepID=A0ABM2ZER1_GOSHI|nr:uncharacterized protein LOC121212294 [Gossypium hirsutum]
MQEGKVVAYASRQFKTHEANNLTHDLELVAVVFTLKIWRHYLYSEKFIIYTNHKSLNKANVVADALIRKAVTDLRTMFARLNLFNDGSLLSELQIESGGTSDFGLNNKGVLYFRGRVCIPKDIDLRQSILQEAHSSPYAMHLRENKMYQDFLELYWWPRLKREVTDFVVKLIRDRQKATSDRQNSYTNLKRKEIEYSVGDLVFSSSRHGKRYPGLGLVMEEDTLVWTEGQAKP